MSDRVEWMNVAQVGVEIIGPDRAVTGEHVDEGNVGILVGQTGNCVLVEGTPEQLLGFVARISEAVTAHLTVTVPAIPTARQKRYRGLEVDLAGGSAWQYAGERWALVERSRLNGCQWLSAHESQEDAADYHVSQDTVDDWEPIKVVDLETGDEWRPIINVSMTLEPMPPVEAEVAP